MTLWAIKNNNNIPTTKRTGKKGDGSLCYVISSPFFGGYYKDSFIILTGWCAIQKSGWFVPLRRTAKEKEKEKGFLSFFSPTICLFFYFLTTNLYNPTNNVSPPFFCIIYHTAPDDLIHENSRFSFFFSFSRDGDDNFRRHVTDVIRIISLAFLKMLMGRFLPSRFALVYLFEYILARDLR